MDTVGWSVAPKKSFGDQTVLPFPPEIMPMDMESFMSQDEIFLSFSNMRFSVFWKVMIVVSVFVPDWQPEQVCMILNTGFISFTSASIGFIDRTYPVWDKEMVLGKDSKSIYFVASPS